MLAAAIRKKIDNEIGDNWASLNRVVDLRTCLLREPVLAIYANPFFDPNKPEHDDNQSKLRLWLVLEEDPPGGYEIVYDEAADLFGLAVGVKAPPRFAPGNHLGRGG